MLLDIGFELIDVLFHGFLLHLVVISFLVLIFDSLVVRNFLIELLKFFNLFFHFGDVFLDSVELLF